MKKNKNIVYVGMSADILHPGHINILKTASKYGNVYVGLLTNKAIMTYKRKPLMNYLERKIVLSQMKMIYKIIPQRTLDYSFNLKLLKPKYVIHGNDWKKGAQSKARKRVLELPVLPHFSKILLLKKQRDSWTF